MSYNLPKFWPALQLIHSCCFKKDRTWLGPLKSNSTTKPMPFLRQPTPSDMPLFPGDLALSNEASCHIRGRIDDLPLAFIVHKRKEMEWKWTRWTSDSGGARSSYELGMWWMCEQKYQQKKSFETNIDGEYQKKIFNLSNRGQLCNLMLPLRQLYMERSLTSLLSPDETKKDKTNLGTNEVPGRAGEIWLSLVKWGRNSMRVRNWNKKRKTLVQLPWIGMTWCRILTWWMKKLWYPIPVSGSCRLI